MGKLLFKPGSPEKVKKQYRFKTTSYKELCKWLKQHEDIITKPQADWNPQDRLSSPQRVGGY